MCMEEKRMTKRMEHRTSGNDTVDRMGTINLSGNIIPQIWYKTITRTNGKPSLLAIALLADIVYWYRPSEVREERSGQIVGWQKRFKGEFLQKTYQQYAELFGESKRSIKAALDVLEELNVIEREFRNVPCENGMVLYNLMYIKLNVDILYTLTYPEQTSERQKSVIESIKKDKEEEKISNTKEDTTYLQTEKGDSTKFCRGYYKTLQEVSQNNVEGSTTECNLLPQKNVSPLTTNDGTNTQNTTQTTNRDNIYPIYPITMKITQEKNDTMDVIAVYQEIIKENIEYDYLRIDYPYQVKQLDEILNLMVETVSVERKEIRIGGAELPFQLVKGKLLKLNSEHIRYVMECIKKNTTKVGNIRSYLLTTLYNAPNTISHYYQSEVNHDIYGG